MSSSRATAYSTAIRIFGETFSSGKIANTGVREHDRHRIDCNVNNIKKINKNSGDIRTGVPTVDVQRRIAGQMSAEKQIKVSWEQQNPTSVPTVTVSYRYPVNNFRSLSGINPASEAPPDSALVVVQTVTDREQRTNLGRLSLTVFDFEVSRGTRVISLENDRFPVSKPTAKIKPRLLRIIITAQSVF